ncbi:hypothetical protein TKK_0016345 [Trichogramma kaykai]|uniref:Bms1-type G domain-containing protein n=1 Tax=Trichogramma kaykai TaxID=54128 RepID=A0ABD2W729_9HYME
MSTPDDGAIVHKKHRERNAGRKADKKKDKNAANLPEDPKQRNPKAFTFNSAIKAERRFRRKQDIDAKRTHVPVVDRTPLEPPPVLVALVGPRKSGKSTLMQCLIKSFSKNPLSSITGPVTMVTGKKARVTFIECNNDINSMIDIAKVADLVLLLINAYDGLEMDTFEFLSMCQVHGMPKVIGVLTHLDKFSNAKQMRKAKKELKHRFWQEIYAGAKLFYLSGMQHEEYMRNEIKNLARFISIQRYRPLTWRSSHPYLLVDRIEDLTDPELIRQNQKTDRTVSVYGYIRGIPLLKSSLVHIAGCGDFKVKDACFLPDPCPLPDEIKKRGLLERERLIYAPFSGVGGIVYDKDAVYVELGGSHSHTKEDSGLIGQLINTQQTLDHKLEKSEIQFFTNSAPLKSGQIKKIFDSSKINDNMDEDRDSDDSNDENEEIEEEEDDDDDDDDDDNGDDDDDDDDDDYEDEDQNDDKTGEKRKRNKKDEVKGNKKIKTDSQLSLKSKKDEDDESFDELSDDEDDFALNLERSDNEDESDLNSDEENKDESETDEEDEGNVEWKEDMAQKAKDAFFERKNRKNIMHLVYDEDEPLTEEPETEENGEEEEIGGIFRVVKNKERRKLEDKELQLEDDNVHHQKVLREDWTADENKVLLADLFVTGKWKDDEDAEELIKLDDMDDEDIYGDFEDLETGKKYTSTNSKSDAEKVPKEMTTDEMDERKKLMEKKEKLKKKFDKEYDNPDKTYLDDWKESVNRQAEINKSEYEDMPDELRVIHEGFRPGMYVRIEIEKMPCEFITNLDASYPIVVGGLLPGEENIGYVQSRIKRHRWYHKILKSKDPLIMSIGWRRFQTIPIFAELEHNLRLRLAKYTPEHAYCMANFWGPMTPQGTGILAIQDVARVGKEFRIAATGTVVELDKSNKIMKKLKLVGEPYAIKKKTAFIKGMFNSDIEVAKFEGARIKTTSGIRGQIKKAVNTKINYEQNENQVAKGTKKVREAGGRFRATFEDKILLSDIVCCRTWYKVDTPQYYNCVTSLLLPPEEKNRWKGMRCVRELKQEAGIKVVPNPDNLYTPVERQPKVFKPLFVPRSLQKSLPYRDKIKVAPSGGSTFEKRRVAVVRDAKEEALAKTMQSIRTIYAYKQEKTKQETAKRIADYDKRIKDEQVIKMKRLREQKKELFREKTKEAAKKEAKMGTLGNRKGGRKGGKKQRGDD